MAKYQTGIQGAVLTVIKESCKTSLPYIKKKYIVSRTIEIFPDLQTLEYDVADAKISQALYHLQKHKKYRRAVIRKFLDKNGP